MPRPPSTVYCPRLTQKFVLWTVDCRLWTIMTMVCAGLAGCITPAYTIRQTPVPDESSSVVQLERTISAYQAHDLERHGVRPVGPGETVFGFEIQGLVDRLSRVTERPALRYRVLLLPDRDPNAAALADGRVYVTAGMLQYLASRGSRDSELAFVLGHEMGHTVAQHLVKRYHQLQQQQMMLAVVGLGAAIAAKQGAQQVGQLAQEVASVISNVAANGYSQEQELEADQLGIRYVIRAGYDPRAALAMVEDFRRYDVPGPFLRTHPPTQQRYEYLERYLRESGLLNAPSHPPGRPQVGVTRLGTGTTGSLHPVDDTRQRLLDAQRLYPKGSQSWKNIQQQLDALKH